MAVVFDNATQATPGSAGTTLTYSHTCTGTDLVLTVAVYDPTAVDRITGVTYNGVAMTRKASEERAGLGFGFIYALDNPATGANNVVITNTTSGIRMASHAMSFSGADSTSNPTSAESNTVDVTSATGDMVADFYFVTPSNGGQTSNQTARLNQADATNDVKYASATAAGGASVTMSYTAGGTPAIIGLNITAAAATAANHWLLMGV